MLPATSVGMMTDSQHLSAEAVVLASRLQGPEPRGRGALIGGIVVLIISLLLLVAAAAVAIVNLQRVSDEADRLLGIQSELHQAEKLQGILSYSARLARSTGQQRWLELHDLTVREYEDALLGAGQLIQDPAVDAELQSVMATSDNMRALEHDALARAAAGDNDVAAEILNGDEYQALRAEQAQRSQTLIEEIDEQANALYTEAENANRVSWSLLIVAAVLFFASGAFLLLQRRRTTREETARLRRLLDFGDRITREVVEQSASGVGLIDPRSGAFVYTNDNLQALLDKPSSWFTDRAAVATILPEGLVGAQHSGEVPSAEHVAEGLRWQFLPLSSSEGRVGGIVARATPIGAGSAGEDESVDEIRAAIDQGRLVLYGQPIIDLETDRMVYLELLTRLRDSDNELVLPTRFLSAAESSGLIVEIDLWVIGNAHELLRHGIPVTINLSSASIASPAVLTRIEGVLSDPDVDPQQLLCEVTETTAITDLEAGKRFVDRINAAGASCALDDFGAGYSGFTYLKWLPVRWLKIDREFVEHAHNDIHDQQFLAAAVTLAQGFGVHTIAEGVENEETLELLRELGVTHVQGFLTGAPAPIERWSQATALG